MASLDKVLRNLESIENEGDIERTINYVRKVNGPLLAYKDYKELKESLSSFNDSNNAIVANQLRQNFHSSPAATQRDFNLLTTQIVDIKENYEDDFI